MSNWNDFFVATAGASAALLGFIFVSISISLKPILTRPKLASRTRESLLLPLTVLLVSCCGLVPNQPVLTLGIELLALGLLANAITLRLGWTMLVLTPDPYKSSYRLSLLMTQLAISPYWLAGSLILVTGWGGMYWIVVGILLSFTKTVYDAWILLIEINR